MPHVVIDLAMPDRAALDNEIARLRGLDVGDLRARWHMIFRRRAPPVSAEILVRRAADF